MPPIGLSVYLLQEEESCRMVMEVKTLVPDWLALASSNVENTVTKTGYGGGRDRGHGPPSVVHVMVSNLTLIVTDSCTHCGRYCHTRVGRLVGI